MKVKCWRKEDPSTLQLLRILLSGEKTLSDFVCQTKLKRQATVSEREKRGMAKAPAEAVALGDLVTALEQATLMAKQLPNANLDPSQILQIYSSLHVAHHQLSLFLSHHPATAQHQRPSLFLPPPPGPANSVSSAADGGGDDDTDMDLMQVVDGDFLHDDDNETEQNFKNTTAAPAPSIAGVEERMRDCFIQNKRPKRSLSPSPAAAVAEQRRSYENEVAGRGGSSAEFDPQGTRLRSLDLIYQFHG